MYFKMCRHFCCAVLIISLIIRAFSAEINSTSSDSDQIQLQASPPIPIPLSHQPINPQFAKAERSPEDDFCSTYCQTLKGNTAGVKSGLDPNSCLCLSEENKIISLRVIEEQLPKQKPAATALSPEKVIPIPEKVPNVNFDPKDTPNTPKLLECDGSPPSTKTCDAFCKDIAANFGFCNLKDKTCICNGVLTSQPLPIPAIFNPRPPPPHPPQQRMEPSLPHASEDIKFSSPPNQQPLPLPPFLMSQEQRHNFDPKKPNSFNQPMSPFIIQSKPVVNPKEVDSNRHRRHAIEDGDGFDFSNNRNRNKNAKRCFKSGFKCKKECICVPESTIFEEMESSLSEENADKFSFSSSSSKRDNIENEKEFQPSSFEAPPPLKNSAFKKMNVQN